MKKIREFLLQIRRKITEYLSTNRLFLSYVFLSLIETILIRNFTVGNTLDYRPLLVDLTFILIVGSFGYLVKPKNQFRYFFVWLVLITGLNIINSIYYTFYLSFASFGLLASVGQVGDVADSLVEKFKWMDFIYLLFPLLFYYVHRILNRTNYYSYVSKVEKGRKMCIATSLVGIILMAFILVTMSSSDYSRINKQWNREYIVERFGIILYQGNDLVQSLTPKINSLFGYDEAARNYREFYTNLATEIHNSNKYTNLLEGMNVVFVHMESVQSFLMDLSFNGEAVTPNLNRIAEEGMFFSNFYPQISVGTSSDTEFTLLTSLMPALSGTVFVSYYNRDYLSIPKIMRENDYYTFSMHGNKADMWNRAKMHISLGYDKFYSKTAFDVNNENSIGLGISDQAFFEQSMPILKEIENSYEKYMGTMITLSNHSPFDDLEKYGEFDLSATVMRYDERSETTVAVLDEYLNNTKIGNYIKSSHYADMALGQFVQYIENAVEFDNTIFVFYGDHDAKLSRSEFEYLYNYDLQSGDMRSEEHPDYVNYDSFAHDLNRKTPLVIWTKNQTVQKKIQSNVDYMMGMYDVLPTLGNMMNFSSPYALGHDIFDKKSDNIVIFPNGNFLTEKIYYNNSQDNYLFLKEGIVLEADYLEKCREYTELRLTVSNDIIVHDLIKKESNKANYSEVVE